MGYLCLFGANLKINTILHLSQEFWGNFPLLPLPCIYNPLRYQESLPNSYQKPRVLSQHPYCLNTIESAMPQPVCNTADLPQCSHEAVCGAIVSASLNLRIMVQAAITFSQISEIKEHRINSLASPSNFSKQIISAASQACLYYKINKHTTGFNHWKRD